MLFRVPFCGSRCHSPVNILHDHPVEQAEWAHQEKRVGEICMDSFFFFSSRKTSMRCFHHLAQFCNTGSEQQIFPWDNGEAKSWRHVRAGLCSSGFCNLVQSLSQHFFHQFLRSRMFLCGLMIVASSFNQRNLPPTHIFAFVNWNLGETVCSRWLCSLCRAGTLHN